VHLCVCQQPCQLVLPTCLHRTANIALRVSCSLLLPTVLLPSLPPPYPTLQVLPEETTALTAQATDDLLSFLTLRAAEFRTGGFLVLNFGTLLDSTR
jgi:hypothetical protein